MKDEKWSPEYIRTDLEKGAMKGISFVWNKAEKQTCWFHHKQAIYRRAATQRL
jgi:hypothetical protein